MDIFESKIVVVGGGIMGCSTAYYLTKLGHKNVTLIESEEIAHAASGRAGGFLAHDWCDSGETRDLARRSYNIHESLSDELGEECGYRKMNTVSVEIAPRDGSGEKYKHKYSSVPQWVDGNVKSCEVIGTTNTTAQVHPKLLTKAFMTAAQRKGAKLMTKRVIGGEQRGVGWWG